ncbi:MAG: beta strand repeat-containing protein [Isosphaeraceae bacterium]
MKPYSHIIFSICRRLGHPRAAAPERRRGRPSLEALERRIALTAIQYTWSGAHGSNWNQADNWDQDVIPPAGAAVVFDGSAGGTVDIDSADVSSITLNGSYTFAPVSDSSQGLTLDNDAIITVSTGDVLTLASNLSLDESGSVVEYGGGEVELQEQGAPDLNLAFYTVGAGTFYLPQTTELSDTVMDVETGGILELAAGHQATILGLTGDGTVNLDGGRAVLSIVAAGAAEYDFSGQIEGYGGTIQMNGTGTQTIGQVYPTEGIYFEVDVESGTLLMTDGATLNDLVSDFQVEAPALYVGPNATFGGLGHFNITGQAEFDAGSALAVELDGPPASGTSTDLDDLPDPDNADTGVQIGADTTVDVTVGSGYAPVKNDIFPIIDAQQGTITGQFASVSTTTDGQSTTDNVPFDVAAGQDSQGNPELTVNAQQSATTTTISASSSSSVSSVYGQQVALEATVAQSGIGSGAPSGPVDFYDGNPASGGKLLGSATLSTQGQATFDTAALAVASSPHQIYAEYAPGGSSIFAPSTSSQAVSVTVTPKTLFVSGLSASNKVYNAATAATLTGTAALLSAEPAGSGSATDGKPYTGDAVTLGGTAVGAFASKNAANGISVTVSGNTLAGAQAGDYVLAANEQSGLTASITAKTLFVSGYSAGNKVYNATTAATLTGAAALLSAESAGSGSATDGKPYTGDAVTLGGTAVGAFASKDAANGISVTVSGNTLGGAQAGNYVLLANEQSGLSANITAKTLFVSGLSAGNKVYNATTTATLTGAAALLSAEPAGSGSATDGKPYTGDGVTLGGTAVGTFASKDAASGISVTVSGNTLTGAQASDYVLAPSEQSGLSANITAKTLFVSGLIASNKVYDATTTATFTGAAALLTAEPVGSGSAADGKPYTDDAVTLGGTAVGAFASKNAANGISVTVSGNTLGGAQASDYVLAANEQSGLTASITAKTLFVSGLSASNKVYDTTTAATLTGAAALLSAEPAGSGSMTDGKPYAGDAVTLGGTAVGAFTSKDAASGISVTVSGNTLSGAQASDYVLAASEQSGLSANIMAKTLFVSGLGATNKVYDGTTNAVLTGAAALFFAEPAGSGSATDGTPYAGDIVTLGGTAVGTFASKDAASGISVTVSGNTLGGAQAGDYVLAANEQSGLTANITAKTLFVSGLSASNKVYDATTAATFTGTASLLTAEPPGSGSAADGEPYTGDAVTLGGTAAGTFASKDAASGITVTVSGNTLSGAQASDYVLLANEQSGLSANIMPKTLFVSGLSVANKVYDATAAATLTGTAALLSAEPAGSGSMSDGKPYAGDAVTLSGTAVGAFTSKNAASGISVKVSGNTLSGAQASDYVLAASEQSGLSASITKRPLTVTANNLTMYAGGPVPKLTYATSGLVGKETASSALSGTLKTTATFRSRAGSQYSITLGTLTAANYKITFKSGILKVVRPPRR